MTRISALALVAMLVATAGAEPAAAENPPTDSSAAPYTFAIGPFVPSFSAPPAGTYELPPIDTVGDHPLVDAADAKTTLAKVVGDRIAVVSFFYGTCSEKNGCPLATAVLHRLDQRIASDTKAAAGVSLVSVSFDPVHDGPERLAAMQRMRAARSTWAFVTAPEGGPLESLLDDFGQTISRLRTEDGRPTGAIRHVLKVYLVDRARKVRNIYSVGFLEPDLVWNDIETLRIEDARAANGRRKATDGDR